MTSVANALVVLPAIDASDPWSIFPVAKHFIDARWERREVLIKQSREITRDSKKLIVALHRLQMFDTAGLAAATDKPLARIAQLCATVNTTIGHPVNKERFYRDLRPGMEELIEALSFRHYLQTGKLLSYEETVSALAASGHSVTPELYILGLMDLGGELMRYATSQATNRAVGIVFAVCHFMQQFFHECLSIISPSDQRDLSKKMETLKASVEKVEKLCYTLVVRENEFMSPDQEQ